MFLENKSYIETLDVCALVILKIDKIINFQLMYYMSSPKILNDLTYQLLLMISEVNLLALLEIEKT